MRTLAILAIAATVSLASSTDVSAAERFQRSNRFSRITNPFAVSSASRLGTSTFGLPVFTAETTQSAPIVEAAATLESPEAPPSSVPPVMTGRPPFRPSPRSPFRPPPRPPFF